MSADSEVSELDSLRTCLSSQFDIDGLQESRIEEMCRLGSMCIYARVRPLLDQEKKEGYGECISIINDQTVQAIAPSDSAKSKAVQQNQFLENFTFTKAFGTNTSQLILFEETLKPTIQNFIEGQNSLVFSYGVTGSGKTFTLQGDSEHPGLIPLSLRLYFAAIEKQISEDFYAKPDKFSELSVLTEAQGEELFDLRENLFTSIQQEEPVKGVEKPFQMFLCDEFFYESYYYKQRETSLPVDDYVAAQAAVRMKEMAFNSANSLGNVIYNIWISFFEIYNECIYDLLQPLKKRTKLTLGEERGDVYVKGLIEIPVSTCDEALKLLEIGRRNLSIASTKLNYQSSRSHCIFSIKVVKFHDLENPLTARVNRLSFCDLAGSERCAKTQTTGARLKEASNINTSLLVLGRCLDMMRSSQSQRNVLPFRESKLTRLISSFFMGRGKAIMLTNASPSSYTFDETLHVLRFSAVAKQVMLNDTYLTSVSETIQSMTDKWARRFSTAEEEGSVVEESFLDTSYDEIQDILKLREEQLEAVVEHARSLEIRVKNFEREKMDFEFQIRKEVVAEMSKNTERYLNDWRQFQKESEAELKKRHQDECEKINSRYEEIIRKKDKKIKELVELINETTDEDSDVEDESIEPSEKENKSEQDIEALPATEEIALMEAREKHMKDAISLKDRITELEKTLTYSQENNKKELDVLEASKKELIMERDEKIKKLEDIVVTHEKRLNDNNEWYEASIAERDEKIECYISEVKDKNLEIQRCEVEIKAKDELISRYEIDFEDQEETIGKYKTDIMKHEKKIKQYEIEIKEKNEQIQKYVNDIKDQVKKIKRYEAEMEDHDGKIKRYEAEIAVRDEAEIEVHDEKIKRYEAEMEDRDEKIKRYEAEMEDRDERIKNYEAEIEVHDEKIKRYEAEMKDRDGIIMRYEAEISVRDEKMKRYEAEIEVHDEKIKRYEAEIEDRDERIKRHEAEMEHRDERIMRCEAEISVCDETIKRYEAEIEVHDEKIKKYEAEIEGRDEKIKRYEAKMEDLDEKIMRYEAEIGVHDEKIKRYESEIEDRDERIKRHEAEMKDRDERIMRCEAEMTNNDEQMRLIDTNERYKTNIIVQDEQLEKYESDIRYKDEQIVQCEAKINEKDMQIKQYESDIKDLEEKIDAWEANILNQNEKLEWFESEIGDKNEQLEKYNSDIRNKEEQIVRCEAKINEKDMQIKQYELVIKDLEGKIDTFETDILNQVEKLEWLESEIKEKNDQLEKYESDIKSKDEQIVQYEAKINEKGMQREQYELVIKDLEGKIDSCETDILNRNEKLDWLESEIKDKNDQLEKYVIDIKNRKKQDSKVMEEIKDLNEQLKIYQADIKKRNNQVEKLEDDIKECNQQIEEKDKKLQRNDVYIQDLNEKINNLEESLKSLGELLRNAKEREVELDRQEMELNVLKDRLNTEEKEFQGAQKIIQSTPSEFQVQEVKCDSSIHNEEKVISKKKTKIENRSRKNLSKDEDIIEFDNAEDNGGRRNLRQKQRKNYLDMEDKENSPEYENEEDIIESDNAEDNVGRRNLRQKQRKNYFDMIRDLDDDDEDFQESVKPKKRGPVSESASKLKKQDSTSSRISKNVPVKSPLKKLTDFVGSNIRSAAQNVASYLSPRAPPPVTTKRVRKIYNPDTAPELKRNSEDGLVKKVQLRRSTRQH